MRKTIATAGVAAVLSAAVACGSGGASAPTSPAAATTPPPVAATPVPTPSATPIPAADVTPTPDPEASPEINDNDAPVERVGAGVYYVDCNGELQPNSRNATQVPLGCRVHIDATAKDADGVPTNPRMKPEWWFSNPSAIDVSGSNPLGPMITARIPHTQRINVWVDGVQSNTFAVTFH